MILDVGCGLRPQGDINLDVGRFVDINKSLRHVRSKCNIIADALHLPFRDRSIEIVYSSHSIEHTSDPNMFLRECERVAIERVIIKCPSTWAYGNPGNKYHKYSFKMIWFVKHGYSPTVSFRFWPNLPFRIVRADEITAIKEL